MSIVPIFLSMKVCCVFSLESPHRGDSIENAQYTIFNIKKVITLNHLKSAAMGFYPKGSRTSSNSRGKRAISVRATEVRLYVDTNILLNVYQLWKYKLLIDSRTSIARTL